MSVWGTAPIAPSALRALVASRAARPSRARPRSGKRELDGVSSSRNCSRVLGEVAVVGAPPCDMIVNTAELGTKQ